MAHVAAHPIGAACADPIMARSLSAPTEEAADTVAVRSSKSRSLGIANNGPGAPALRAAAPPKDATKQCFVAMIAMN